MKCKTSCFNPSLAKNDLRRFWPLPVCSFLVFFVSLVLPLYRHLYSAISGQLGYYTVDGEALVQIITAYAGTQFVIQTLILAAAALVTALLLFHHLHGKKEIQFYLSLPMRRSGCSRSLWRRLLLHYNWKCFLCSRSVSERWLPDRCPSFLSEIQSLQNSAMYLHLLHLHSGQSSMPVNVYALLCRRQVPVRNILLCADVLRSPPGHR